MTRKMFRTASVAVGGLTLALALTACGDSNEVDSVEAQDGAALQELLLTDGESGLTGATGVNDTVLEGETIPLVVVAEAEKFEGACGEALQAAEAAAGVDVLFEIVPECDQGIEHQLTGIDADGTVSGIHHNLSGGFDPIQNIGMGVAVQNFPDHLGQLIQTDPARSAFAAGLGLTQAQKVQCHIHGAQARRICLDPALHAAVDLFDHSLRLSRHSYFKSTHILSYLS